MTDIVDKLVNRVSELTDELKDVKQQRSILMHQKEELLESNRDLEKKISKLISFLDMRGIKCDTL